MKTANKDLEMLSTAEMFERVLELTVRPVVEGGTYDFEEFKSLGTDYLDCAIEPAGTFILKDSSMALNLKAQFAASLYLISKVKAVHDSIADIKDDDFKRKLETKQYYALLNRILTWMYNNLNSEMSALALGIIIHVLNMEIVPDLVDGYREFIKKFSDAEKGAEGAMLPVIEYLNFEYNAGNLDWAFGASKSDADIKIPVPETGNADVDTLLNSVIKPAFDNFNIDWLPEGILIGVVHNGIPDRRTNIGKSAQLLGAVYLAVKLQEYRADNKGSFLDTRNFHDRTGFVINWLAKHANPEIEVLAYYMMFIHFGLFVTFNKFSIEIKAEFERVMEYMHAKGAEWENSILKASEYAVDRLQAELRAMDADAGVPEDAIDLTDSKTKAELKSQLDAVLEPYGLKTMEHQCLGRICDGGINQIDFGD